MPITRYIIVKRSRYPTLLHGYEGPACKTAGIEPGLVYISPQLAKRHAIKLGEANPVGFDVWKVDMSIMGKITTENIEAPDAGITQ